MFAKQFQIRLRAFFKLGVGGGEHQFIKKLVNIENLKA